MQVTCLEFTTQGTDKEDLEENAFEIAKRFFDPQDYEITNASRARYVESRSDAVYSLSERRDGFEADFRFRLIPS